MRLFRRSGSSIPAELLLVAFLTGFAAAGDLLDRTLDTGENLLGKTPLTVMGAGAAGSLAAFLLEPGVGCAGFLPETPFKTLDRTDDVVFGYAVPASSAGIWLIGAASGERGMEGTGEELCRGLFYTYGITAALKYSLGRARPDMSTGPSFPSAHAAAASCAAAVLWARHGEAAGIIASAAALYTCLSRVNMGRHFPSDVIMGAAIGTACGLAASLDDEREGADGLTLAIFIDGNGRIHPASW